jgi:hypothetical protein
MKCNKTVASAFIYHDCGLQKPYDINHVARLGFMNWRLHGEHAAGRHRSHTCSA